MRVLIHAAQRAMGSAVSGTVSPYRTHKAPFTRLLWLFFAGVIEICPSVTGG